MLQYFRYFPLLLTFYFLLPAAAVLADSTHQQTDEQTDISQDNSILTNHLLSKIPSEQEESIVTKTGEAITQHQSEEIIHIAPQASLAQANNTETPQPPPDKPTNPTETPQPSSDKSTSPIENINSDQEKDKWHFKFQPYAFIPVSTYGNATVKGRTVDYSLGLGSLLEVLRVAAAGNLEAWHNDLGFIISANYASLNGSGIKVSNPPLRANLSSFLTFDQGIYDFALSYHLGAPAMYSLPDKPSNKSFPLVWFEPIAGVRLNALTASIDSTLNFGRIDASFQRNFSGGRTWFEPMLGGKIGIQVSDPVTLWVQGKVSGFGLAGDTDLSWSVIFGADWWVSKTISLQLGYGFFQLNYQNGTGNNAFGLEENFNGPYLSATFNF